MKVIAGSWEPTSTILSVDVVTKENSTSLMRSLGWGTAGLIGLGPLGLVAGAVVGASKSSTIVSVKYHNGKQALLQCKTKELKALMGASFNQTSFKKPPQKVGMLANCFYGVVGLLAIVYLIGLVFPNPSKSKVGMPQQTVSAPITTVPTPSTPNKKVQKVRSSDNSVQAHTFKDR